MDPKETPESFADRIKEEHLEDLHALCDVLGLTVLREEKFNGTWSVVVDDGRGEEVHIGFPDGTHGPGGHAYPPAATGKIFEPAISMGTYGHGAWTRSIEI